MSDSIDDLLAQVQAQYNHSVANPKPRQPQIPSLPSPPSASADSIEDLLADLDDRPKQASAPALPLPNPLPLTHSSYSTPSVQSQMPSHRDPAIDHLMSDLKTVYQEQDRAEAVKQQQQRQEEQQRQATVKRQQQAARVRQAEAWLKTLDPRGGEGAWFEEFAAKYPSRVEAAIEYLGLEPE